MEDISGLVSCASWIKILLLLYVNWPSTECYYELSSSEHEVCSSGTQINTTIDLVCRLQERTASRNSDCTVTEIKWFRTSGVNTYEISTSSKYSVWESIEGWGVDKKQSVALLRIRDFGLGDIARYSCHVTCDFGSGVKRVLQLHTDVCLDEPNVKGLQCPVLVEENSCSYNFQNGRCDHICDVREHLFDGFDCAVDVPECPYNEQCTSRYADGVCNQQCNIPECQWDGGDCIDRALDLAHDHILIKVEKPQTSNDEYLPNHRKLKYRLLSRHFSSVTRSLLRNVREPRKEEAFAIEDSHSYGYLPHNLLDSKIAFDNVVLKLDNTNCEKRCLKHVDHVASFLQLSNSKDALPDLNIHAITVLREKPQICKSSNTSLLHLEFTDTAPSYNLKNSHIDHSEEAEPPDWDFNIWIIGICVIGTLVILGLLVGIFGVIICIRSEQQNLRMEKNRIHSPFHKDVNTSKAVDV